jgi:hypothetical protein
MEGHGAGKAGKVKAGEGSTRANITMPHHPTGMARSKTFNTAAPVGDIIL